MKKFWVTWSPGAKRLTIAVGSLGSALIITLITWPTPHASSYLAQRSNLPRHQYQSLALEQGTKSSQLPEGQAPEVPWAGIIPLVTVGVFVGAAYRQTKHTHPPV